MRWCVRCFDVLFRLVSFVSVSLSSSTRSFLLKALSLFSSDFLVAVFSEITVKSFVRFRKSQVDLVVGCGDD